jgi:hypothetical protein
MMKRLKSAIIPIVWALTGFASFSFNYSMGMPDAPSPVDSLPRSSSMRLGNLPDRRVELYMCMMYVSHGELYLLDTLRDDGGLGDMDTRSGSIRQTVPSSMLLSFYDDVGLKGPIIYGMMT